MLDPSQPLIPRDNPHVVTISCSEKVKSCNSAITIYKKEALIISAAFIGIGSSVTGIANFDNLQPILKTYFDTEAPKGLEATAGALSCITFAIFNSKNLYRLAGSYRNGLQFDSILFKRILAHIIGGISAACTAAFVFESLKVEWGVGGAALAASFNFIGNAACNINALEEMFGVKENTPSPIRNQADSTTQQEKTYEVKIMINVAALLIGAAGRAGYTAYAGNQIQDWFPALGAAGSYATAGAMMIPPAIVFSLSVANALSNIPHRRPTKVENLSFLICTPAAIGVSGSLWSFLCKEASLSEAYLHHPHNNGTLFNHPSNQHSLPLSQQTSAPAYVTIVGATTYVTTFFACMATWTPPMQKMISNIINTCADKLPEIQIVSGEPHIDLK